MPGAVHSPDFYFTKRQSKSQSKKFKKKHLKAKDLFLVADTFECEKIERSIS